MEEEDFSSVLKGVSGLVAVVVMPLARVQGALGGLYGIESRGFEVSSGSDDKVRGAAVARGEEVGIGMGDFSCEN
jgi:hypothetical protein